MKDLLVQCFDYWSRGGALLVPIAVICFGIWFYFLRLYFKLESSLRMSYRLQKSLDPLPPAVAGAAEIVRQRCRAGSDLCTKVITYIYDKVGAGGELEDVCDEIHTSVFARLKRDIGVLEALVYSAPLLGLLGTVLGMIRTFDIISSVNIDSTRQIMASGISQALITTQIGLVVALAGVFGISALKRRLRQLEVRFYFLQTYIAINLRKAG